MLNHISLIGRITKNPEIQQSSNGDRNFTRFTLAVNDTNSDRTDFIPCFAWNKTAENVVKYVRKGALLAVEGKLTALNKNSDTSFFVTANRVIFLERRKDVENNNLNLDSNNSLSNNNEKNEDFFFDKNNNSNNNNTSNLFEYDSKQTNNDSNLNNNSTNKSLPNDDKYLFDDDYDIKWD